MIRQRRHVTVFVLTAVVVLAVLAATAYAVRGRLAETPLVADLFTRLGWRAVADPQEVPAWTCPMHPEVHADEPGACPICGMPLQPVPDAHAHDQTMPGTMAEMGSALSDAQTPGLRRAEVTIDSRRQQLLGVRTRPVERQALTKSIRTVGTVRYDETRLTDINLKLPGWIEELSVDYTGKFVEQGQPLFTLYSPELVMTQHEYLLALQTRDQLRESPIADAREYADRLVEAARQRLVLWDLPPDQIQALDEQRKAQRTMVFRSPVSGFVIEKHVLRGQHVPVGMSLYTIADLSVVWVEADIYESELPLIRDGIGATVTVDAYPGERYRGRVIYLYPYVEERTRTVRVRFEFRNPHGRLKPGMYANVVLEAPMGTGLVVPANALLDSGTERYVFVSSGDGYFDPRPVVVGQRLGETVQILEGLEAGERVATSATFFNRLGEPVARGVAGVRAVAGGRGGAGQRAAAA